MPKCSVLSIYDDDVRNFIRSLQWYLHDTRELKDWLYEEGLTIIFQEAELRNKVYLNQCKKESGRYPIISPCYIIGYHYTGLIAVRKALIEKFKSRVSAHIIEQNFNGFLLSAIDNHTVFITALAEVFNDWYALLDKNNALSPAEMDQAFITLLKAKQEKYPCEKYPLEAKDFRNHLTFDEELFAKRPKPNPQQLFTQPATPVQALSAPANTN